MPLCFLSPQPELKLVLLPNWRECATGQTLLQRKTVQTGTQVNKIPAYQTQRRSQYTYFEIKKNESIIILPIYSYMCFLYVYTERKINQSISKDIYSSSLSSSVKQGVNYQYTIQVEADGLLSDPSPPLLYTHGQPYCGDGHIQGSVTVFLLHIG